MKKNFILLLCIISLFALALVSCNKVCDHTFSDKWYSDATNHWHPATCEHAETEKSGFAPHVDSNEDGVCDVCEYEIGHVHTYEEAWTITDTHHWKKATCAHTDEKGNYSTHSDEDLNSACDVCGGHVHNVNAAGYCKYDDCGKKVRDIDETSLDELVAAILVQKHLVNGGNIDYDFTGKSNTGLNYYASKHDVIDFVFGKDNYTHILVNTYTLNAGINTKIPEAAANGNGPSFGENGNWWIGGTDTGVKVNAVNTPFLSEGGTWFIGGVDTEISEAAANGATPYFDADGNWWIGNTNTNIKVQPSNTPTVGKSGTWIIGGNDQTGDFESWHQLSGAESVFGVVSENGGALALDLPEAAKLNGYYISMSTLVGEYGVEELLYGLYEVAISDTSDSLEIIPANGENKVTFKYNYTTAFINEHNIVIGDNAGSVIYNVNYFNVEVTFKYTDDYALTDLMILVDCYTNDPGTADGYGFLYPDVDIEYDPETGDVTFVEYVQDENGNWVAIPTDKRTPDTYVINVTQTIGERTEENPYPKSKFVPESFELYMTRDEETNELSDIYDGKLITVSVRDILNFYVGKCMPEGTSIHFAQDSVSFKVFHNGVEVENPQDYENPVVVAMFTMSGEQRSFFFIPKTDGAFRFEIYVMDNKVYDIGINAGAVDEEYVPVGKNQFAVKVSETHEWSTEYSFTATIAGTYYFTLPKGVGFVNADAFDAAELTPETDDSPAPYLDYNTHDYQGRDEGVFSITLKANETIRFYVSAAKRGTYVISYAVIDS